MGSIALGAICEEKPEISDVRFVLSRDELHERRLDVVVI
jgi:hypothetical protein